MILQVEQINKELYSADFRIWRAGGLVGTINVQGKPGQMEADARIGLFEKSYVLSCDRNAQAAVNKAKQRENQEQAYRPYLINGGNTGSVCQVERKTGVFSKAFFREMIFENEVINMYSKSFKTEAKNSIYCQGRQSAQVDVSSEIVDDMYHYTAYAVDQKSAETAVLYCAYMYILTGFKPGQKITKGRHKQVMVSFDRTFDDKYDSNFVKYIDP